MRYEFEVFISYAHEDGAFVRDLVRRLRAAGIEKTWLDEERMRGGDDVVGTLNTVAGTKARHALFVVSDAWLASDYADHELRVFRQNRQAGRRAVPILRFPRDEEKLKPGLGALASVEWLEDAPDPDARFWLVYCGLRDLEPGPRDTWHRRGLEAQGKAAAKSLPQAPSEVAARAVEQAARRSSQQVLTCDRDPQWGKLVTRAKDHRNEAIFVVGPQRQGHRFFLERILSCLPRDPLRRTCIVDWRPRPPQARGPARAALAAALECSADRLERTLRGILAHQNLVLVHLPVFEEARAEPLVYYYTRWIPELLDASLKSTDEDPVRVGSVKLIQAVRWPPVGGLELGLARLALPFGLTATRWGRRCLKVRATRSMLRTLRAAARPELPIVRLRELDPIPRKEVEEWAATLDLGPQQQDELVDYAFDGSGETDDVLRRLAEKLDPQGVDL